MKQITILINDEKSAKEMADANYLANMKESLNATDEEREKNMDIILALIKID